MSRLKKYFALFLAVVMIMQYSLVSLAEENPAEPAVTMTDSEDTDAPGTITPEDTGENDNVSTDAAGDTAASAEDSIEDANTTQNEAEISALSEEDGKVDSGMTAAEIQAVVDANEVVTFAEGTYENLSIKIPDNATRVFATAGKVVLQGSKGSAISLGDSANLTLQGGEFEIAGYAVGISIASSGNHNFTVSSGVLNCHDLVRDYGDGGISVTCKDGNTIHLSFGEGTSFICTNSYSGIEINNSSKATTGSVYTTFNGCQTINLSENGKEGSLSGSGIQAANSENIYQEIKFVNCQKVNLDNNHLDAVCFQDNDRAESSLTIENCPDVSFSRNGSWGTNGGNLTVVNSTLRANNNAHSPWGKVSRSASNLYCTELTVSNSTIQANEAGVYCGIWVAEMAKIQNNSVIETHRNGLEGEDEDGIGCYFAGNALIEDSEVKAEENKETGIFFDYNGTIQNSTIVTAKNETYGIVSWVGLVDVADSYMSCTDTVYSFEHMGYSDNRISRLKIENNTVARLQGSENEITEGNYGRTYVISGSLQALSSQMYPKTGTLGLNEQIDSILENRPVTKEDKDWTKPINTDGTSLTRFNLNAEINQEVGASAEEVQGKAGRTFTYYDPNTGTEYTYSFRYNTEGEDLTEGESGNAYVWAPVSILHYDATEGRILLDSENTKKAADSTAYIGQQALKNTRGDGSSVGNKAGKYTGSSRYATDYTIYGNSLQLSEGKIASAAKSGSTFSGWWVCVEDGKVVDISSRVPGSGSENACETWEEFYGLLNTQVDETTPLSDTLAVGMDEDAEFTVYAKWTKNTGETPTAPDWTISKSKTAADLDKNYESKVTLSLPAADWQRDMDVVFVLDKSTSHKQTDIVNQAVDMLENLSEKDNLNIKAGVVVFAKELMDESSQSLVSLDKAGLAELEAIMTKDFDEESGTNLQAGVEAARALLNADTEVGEQDKYIVLLTDGGARQFLNENGKTVSQVFNPNGNGNWWGSNSDFTDGRYANNNPYGAAWRTFEDVWADTQNVEDNTYAATEKEKDSIDGATWDTVRGNPNYYTSMERAVYYGAKSIVNAADEANVIFVSYPYYKGHECGNLYAYTESFKDWLETNQLVSMYNTENVDAAGIFKQIENELIYAVDAGSTVLDVIGYDDTYNNGMGYHFDFVNDIKKLTLTVGGETLKVTQIDDTTYGFGKADGSKDGTTYPFVLYYYPNGTSHADRTIEDECFVWDINVPVMKNAQVQLTYSVLLTDPTKIAGSYTELNTNLEAVLYPKDSNGQDLPAEWFERPTVKYTVTDKPEKPTTPDKKPEKPQNEQKSKTPKTGDQSNLALWGSLLGVSVIILIMAGVLTKKHRKRRR